MFSASSPRSKEERHNEILPAVQHLIQLVVIIESITFYDFRLGKSDGRQSVILADGIAGKVPLCYLVGIMACRD